MLEIGTEFTEVGGGRAGIHEFGWRMAGYNLHEIEPLRQKLLRQNDYAPIQKAMQQLGIVVSQAILRAVKRYNFDSQGIGFGYDNYTSWRRVATGVGKIGDAAYLVHEIAEVEQLQRIQSQTAFDFMGKSFDSLTRLKRQQWPSDFDRYYKQAHSKALEAEYEFVAEQVNRYINRPKSKISKLQAAAIDPTRYIHLGVEETESARYMLIDGVIMREHHHYETWRKRANELLPLSKTARRKLQYYTQEVRVDTLITLVKNRLIG